MTSTTGEILSTNVSEKKGTVKKPVDGVKFVATGIEDDAHAGNWIRQISLLSSEHIEDFSKESGREIHPGDFAENLSTKGIDLGAVSVLDRLTIGEVELEVTQIGKACHGDGCAIFRDVGRCVMPKEGIFARVKATGEVKPGDEIVHHPRPLKFRVITVSDRVSQGVYADRSGPRLKELIAEFMAGKRWHTEIDSAVIRDEREDISRLLQQAFQERVDVVFTTGGTGVGPRDVTPEAAVMLCHKLIPGIMEHCRTKFGAKKPAALLSRGIAGVSGTSLIFTLPGSRRAVQEYAAEILPLVEHLIKNLHGIDDHS